MTGVRIVRVVQKLCAGLDCPLRFCDEVISLDKTAMSTHSTARLSFVTPRHLRTATCQCEGRLMLRHVLYTQTDARLHIYRLLENPPF